MESLLGIDPVTLRQALVVLALGAATLVLMVRGATSRRHPVRMTQQSRAAERSTMLATLEAVYLRGDITRQDYVVLSRRLRGR
jgi:uncharacterized membrane protein